MIFCELASWLKDSVFGIVILGALGSALYLLVSNFLKTAFVKWLPTVVTKYRNWRGDRAYELGKKFGAFDRSEYQFGSLHLTLFKAAKSVVCAIASGIALLVFLLLFLSGEQALTWGSYVALVVSMVFGLTAYMEFSELRLVSDFFCGRANKQSDATAQSKDDS
jgi:hypothetical protein